MVFNNRVKDKINNSGRLDYISTSNAVVDGNTFNQITNSKLFKYNNKAYNSKIVELSFQNEYFFNYIVTSIKNSKKGFDVYNCDCSDEELLDKSNIFNIKGFDFISLLDSYIDVNAIKTDAVEKKRVDSLKNLMDFNNYLNQNQNFKITIPIDGAIFTFRLNDFVYLLNLTKAEFNSIYLNENILTFIEFNKYRLLYAAIKFFEDNNLNVLYDLPPNMKEKFVDNSYMYDIDLEAVNSINDRNKFTKDFGPLDKDLKLEILGNMPAGLAKIDMVIYIYSKMCEIFNYDPMFNTDNKNFANVVHNSQTTIDNINLDNTNINSKEFMAIFTTLLGGLDIDYTISAIINYEDYNKYGECFNPSSYNIILRVDKYLLKVDFMKAIVIDSSENTSVLDFVGLECINKHPYTQKSYINKLDNYNTLIEQKSDVNYIGYFQSKLQELVGRVENLPSDYFNDKLLFILNYYNEIFTYKEREKNVNLLTSEFTDESCVVVFVTNDRKLQKNNSYNNNYYLYKLGFGLIKLDPEQFNYMYNDNKNKTK